MNIYIYIYIFFLLSSFFFTPLHSFLNTKTSTHLHPLLTHSPPNNNNNQQPTLRLKDRTRSNGTTSQQHSLHTKHQHTPMIDLTTIHNMTNPYDSPPASPRYTPLGPSSSPNLSSAQQIRLQPPPHTLGEIKLIGAGPGDPDLLTMAAYKAITIWADIVLADKLVSKEILALVKCPLFVANKDKGCQASGQQELFERATQALKEGKKVVRLKQGGKHSLTFVKHLLP
jgi:hypothetical protein